MTSTKPADTDNKPACAKETITDRIRLVMKDKDVRQVDIVTGIGVSKSSVSKWVSGTAVPQKHSIDALALLLGVSADWLQHGDDTGNYPINTITPIHKPLNRKAATAQRLKIAMYNKDIMQADLHKKLGTTREHVSRWLSGDTLPHKTTLRKIADILDISFDWLAYGGNEYFMDSPALVAVPNKDLSNGVPERLKEAMYNQNMIAADVATQLGASRGAVSKWLSGDATPSHEYMKELANLLGSSFKWLAYGHIESVNNPNSLIGDIKLNHNQISDIRFSDEPADENEYEATYCKVLYPSQTAIIEAYKANKPLQVIARSSATIKIQRSLADRCGASTEHSFCYRNESDSMTPKLLDNALCIADRSRTEVRDGKIYCFRHGVTLKTRYLRRRPDGGLLIVSENKSYPDEIVLISELHTVAILGWVYCMKNTDTW